MQRSVARRLYRSVCEECCRKGLGEVLRRRIVEKGNVWKCWRRKSSEEERLREALKKRGRREVL